MKKESGRIANQIGNLVSSLSNGLSKAVSAKILELEKKKESIDEEIDKMEKLAMIPAVTEEDIRNHFARARELIISGQLPEIRQLINLYVDRVVVYMDKVEVYLHMLPGFCMQGMAGMVDGKDGLRRLRVRGR